MSRRQQAVKRHVPADPKYGSTTVTKFINSLMLDGKKSTAEGIFYDAMRVVEEKTGQPAVNVFKQALNNVKPAVEVRPTRCRWKSGRSGATRSRSSGSCSTRGCVVSARWRTGSRTRFSPLPATRAAP